MSPAPTPELHQVLYVSRSRTNDLGEIRRLHETCARNNAKLGLTGLLVYTGSHFAQLLEGAPRTMSEMMWRIAHDDRHARMRKLFTKPMSQRICAGWGMKLVIAEDADDQVRQLVDAIQPPIQDAASLLGRMQDLASRTRSVA